MKVSLLVVKLLALNLIISSVFAGPPQSQPENLEKIDLLKTCKTPQQIEAAEKALGFLNDFRWWNVKGMYDSVHEDYVGWHASWAHTYLRSAQWSEAQKFIFPPQGQFTKKTMMKALAYSAYTNDVGEYVLKIKRLDCVSGATNTPGLENQKVIVSSDFHGTIVLRDDAWGGKGYIRFLDKIVEPTRVTFNFKEGMISESLFDLRDQTGDEVTGKLFARLMAYRNGTGPVDIPTNDPKRRGSFMEIYNCFLSEIDPSKTCTLDNI
jgi:hypothetical protein